MSVTDPFIRDIKGCVQEFLKTINNHEDITDNYFYLVLFCNTIEKIFDNGLITQQNTLYFNRQIDAYAWMASIVKEKCDIIAFPYVNCVDNVKGRVDLQTNYGRFRLLVKYCLAKKCLHVPIEFLMRTKKVHIFYQENSIIGDEILSEIFLSVLLQISKLNFKFDLNNSSFLDSSWYIPDLVRLELVPCTNLGLSLSFSGEKAVIVAVESNSVAAENGKIHVGDVLVQMNGIHISSSAKGRLNSIFKSHRGLPINLTVAKAYSQARSEFFSPIKVLLKDLKIDADLIKKQYEECGATSEHTADYEIAYIGSVDVGNNGTVKQVNKAMKKMLSSQIKPSYYLDDADDDGNIKVVERIKQPVVFEIGEIGVKIKHFQTNNIIFDHSYMKMSSCGCIPMFRHHFAYIAGDENCDVANKFVCFIFEVNKPEVADSILQSIGQGFRRTHFAV